MSKAIREVYGEALVKYGKDNQNVVVLDADVSSSTKTDLFGKAYPDRFLNVGIAEANMAAMAAGLAAAGKIPFANTFAAFLSSLGLLAAQSYGSYSQLPIKLAGAYGGMSDMFDGPSHHALNDIAIMRSLPHFQVFVPADAAQASWLVKYAIDTPKPMYLRLSRDVFPDIYPADEPFACGKGKLVRDGRDASVIACGLSVGNALAAADLLAGEGISLRVVDMFCVKPVDTALILRCARETGAIVCAEEHSIIGGLGSAVAEVLAENGCGIPLGFAGVSDRHGECGPYRRLQEKYGLDAAAIAAKVRSTLQKR